MKAGDVIKFKPNKCRDWGDIALVYKVTVNPSGTGQVHLINYCLPGATIPWATRNEYIEVLIEG